MKILLYAVHAEEKGWRQIAAELAAKGHEIVLAADDSDFENEIKPGQFEYYRNEVPFRSVKNVRIA